MQTKKKDEQEQRKKKEERKERENADEGKRKKIFLNIIKHFFYTVESLTI